MQTRRIKSWRCLVTLGGLGLYAGVVTPFIVFIEEPAYAFAFVFFFLVTLAVSIYNTSTYGLLSWSAGIPWYYLLLFCLLPILEQIVGTRNLAEFREIPSTLLIATLGLVSFFIGNHLTVSANSPKCCSAPGLAGIWPFTELNSAWIVLGLTIIGAAALSYTLQYGYYGLIPADVDRDRPWIGVTSIGPSILEVALAVSWIQYFSSNPTCRWWKPLSWFLLLVLLIAGAFAISKSVLLRPLAIVGIAYFAVKRRPPLQLLAIGFLAYIFIAFPLVAGFRAVTALADVDRLQLLSSIWSYITDFRIDDILTLQSKDIRGETNPLEGLSRSLLVVFATIVQDTGLTQPYAHGDTYLAAIEAFLPRFIWPDKPAMSLGNYIGQQYGLVSIGDYVTNLAPSQMGEAYMNFGLFGIIIVMFAWGWLARRLDRSVFGAQQSWVRVLGFLMIAFQEAPIGHTLVPTAKVLSALFLILVLMGTARRACVLPLTSPKAVKTHTSAIT